MIILDWIFEGIVTWISSIASQIMDAVSGIFLNALGTDMTAMEEYFPFITKAFDVMQYTAWAVLFLITVWQLFRVFGGPITEAENPWQLVARSAVFALLIGYAKPIFMITLDIARAPYTALMDVTMAAEDFTFAGIEQVLTNGLVTIVSTITIVAPILVLILLIALGWNYFKLLLEVVERYIVVGVLCYTSPLAFAMGGSKTTNQVFKSWCRMVGSQLLLLVLNVWFLRGFNSSVGQYIGNGGALSSGQGTIFLWLFCALAFLKTAQKFDSYLAAMGLNVAQTGSSMGMELLMAARVLSGVGSGARSAGSVFRGGSTATGTGAAASGFAAGFASKFKGNSYVRDAVVEGGERMGMGGSVGFVGRAFGGVAARNGATLTGESISSVAARPSGVSGSIAGDIADRSLSNYMPQLGGYSLKESQISGGHISTTATGTDGKTSSVEMYSAAQFEKPSVPHSVVTASDGSSWYQMASGEGRGAFYDAPEFTGAASEAAQVASAFPGAAEGTTLRTVGDGVMEASGEGGNTLGTTAPTTPSLTRPTALCSPRTAWTGTSCNSRRRRPSLNPEIRRWLTTRLYSVISCPATNSRLHRLTAPIAKMGISRSNTRMAPARRSTILPDTPHRAAIIRCLKTLADSSGLPFTASPLWSADPSMKTESPYMTAKASAPYRWNRFDTRAHPAASANPRTAGTSSASRRNEKVNIRVWTWAGRSNSSGSRRICKI